MSFLLDTNAVSEWMKPRPNPGLISWLEDIDEDRVFLSVVTLTELSYGVERLASGKRRKQLEDWLENDLPTRFENRILAIDRAVADVCGKIVAQRDTQGRPIAAMDAYIAATAEVFRLTLVTRNQADFDRTVGLLLNPWTRD